MLTANSQSETHPQEVIWGVISYVRADIAWCEWLYFTINGYPVPVALAARATRDGFGLPETLSVFPDPDGSDNADRYSEALQAGRYLVVICSPHSSQCSTVESHIRDFKKGGGEERIIVLVVEGEPTKGAGRQHAGPSKWLPPWLRWRLDDNGSFVAAERSEPLIIDARPGRMNLDDIMASLLAALLDVPRVEFDAASGPHPQIPERDETHLIEQEGMVEQIWAELAPAQTPQSEQAEPRPAPGPPAVEKHIPAGKRNVAAIVIVAAAALGLVLWWLCSAIPTHRSQSGEVAANQADPPPPSRAESLPPRPTFQADALVQPPEEPSTQPEPVAPTPDAVSQPPTPQLLPADPVTPINSIASEAPTPPHIPAKSPPNIPSDVPPAVLTPDQIADEAAKKVNKEETDARQEADRLIRSGRISDALPLYIRALDHSERYAALRAGDSAAELETAKLCLIVGSLQSNYSSTAEALQTFETGRRILGKMKSGKTLSDERSRTLNSLQLQIRRLADDAPRRRAQKE